MWHSTPTPKWFLFAVRSTGAIWQFNGTSAIPVPASSLAGDLADQINPAKGAALVGYKGRTLADVEGDHVNIKDFGAVCDGVTDDSAAVQDAVDYCATFPNWPALIIPGPTRLVTSVVINRLVGTTDSEFRIIGRGSNAGFNATASLNMFVTTLPTTTLPQSEHIAFIDIQFTSLNNALAIFTLGTSFLRVRFEGCWWQWTRAVNSPGLFAQDYRFIGCKADGWVSAFFLSKGAYYIESTNCVYEFGAIGFSLIDATGGTGNVGCCFMGNLFEGCSGEFVQGTFITGMEVSGNYFEGNSAGSIAFDYGFPNKGISLSGNFYDSTAGNQANPAFFEVRLGPTSSVSSNGNHCTGRLYNTAALTGAGLQSWGDSATIEVWSGNKTGLLDSTRTAAVGHVSGVDPDGLLYTANGQSWVALDGAFKGLAVGPGVVQGGEYIPLRFLFGPDSPQTNNAFYGNPYWTIGSRISNTTPVVGQPKGWMCTVSGQPGTWVSEGNL